MAEQTIKKIPLKPFSGSNNNFKIVLSDKLEKQIRTLCALSPQREWSGVLFYTFKGTFKDGVTINADEMYLMDQGSMVHTEFDLDAPEITRHLYMEGLMDHCIGLIHSHNTMAAFFSGEDSQTLVDHGCHMHNFVSLVVNNKGEYVARLTRQVAYKAKETRTIEGKYKSPLFNTDEIEENSFSSTSESEITDECIEYVDLNVERPEVLLEEEVVKRFGEISSKCSKAFDGKGNPFGCLRDVSHPDREEKVKQGKLFDDFDGESFIADIPKDVRDELSMIPWEKTSFEDCLSQLLWGSPFVVQMTLDRQAVEALNKMYRRRFPIESDFEAWFDLWIDFIISEFHIPASYTDPEYFTEDDEELFMFKVYDIVCKNPFVYKNSMAKILANRLMM